MYYKIFNRHEIKKLILPKQVHLCATNLYYLYAKQLLTSFFFFQYADDVVFTRENNEINMLTMKSMLRCFKIVYLI